MSAVVEVVGGSAEREGKGLAKCGRRRWCLRALGWRSGGRQSVAEHRGEEGRGELRLAELRWALRGSQ